MKIYTQLLFFTALVFLTSACVEDPKPKKCEGEASRACVTTNGTGSQFRTCTDGKWSEYSACVDDIISDFKIGDKIQLVKLTNVRSSAGIQSTNLLGKQQIGALGTIIEGPSKTVDNFIWWKVDFESGVDGFAGEDNYSFYDVTMCDGAKSGEEQSRELFEKQEVSSLDLCKKVIQKRTCQNGTWESWSPATAYQFETCSVPTQSQCSGGTATSISQFGITWTFDKAYPCGQYANGDYWVKGSVKITKITPESVTTNGWTKNGTVVNPLVGAGQGFDSSMNGYLGIYYNESWNVAPSFTGSPLIVTTGSVVSSISRSTPGTASTRPQITDAAVLTVVSSVPSAGAFRPPLAGNDKTSYWNKSQLNYSILKSLAPVQGTPALATVEASFERPWFAHMEGSPARYIAPLNNMPEYGRDQAHTLTYGLLSLHLNYTKTQKEKLYIRLVQYGIDIYGAVKAGMVFLDYGGLNAGRKASLVLAALALNHADMKVYADAKQKFIFHDDRQIWIVTKDDIGRSLYPYSQDSRVRDPYTQAHVGLPEWGSQHTKNLKWDGSNWGVYYRNINGEPLQGHALMGMLTTGGREAWNWEPFFLYADRFWSIEAADCVQAWSGREFSTKGIYLPGQTSQLPNAITIFVWEMWKTYRKSAGPIDSRFASTCYK